MNEIKFTAKSPYVGPYQQHDKYRVHITFQFSDTPNTKTIIVPCSGFAVLRMAIAGEVLFRYVKGDKERNAENEEQYLAAQKEMEQICGIPRGSNGDKGFYYDMRFTVFENFVEKNLVVEGIEHENLHYKKGWPVEISTGKPLDYWETLQYIK